MQSNPADWRQNIADYQKNDKTNYHLSLRASVNSSVNVNLALH